MQDFFKLINKDGWKFIGIFAVVASFMALFSDVLGIIGLTLTLWCIYFFRDPVRVTPIREGLVIAPADGRILSITASALPMELQETGGKESDWTKISIFLNIFDVHVNRIPMSGSISKAVYNKGLFFNASLDKASEHNERQSLLIRGGDKEIGCVQIAGLIARRIRCDVSENQEVIQGNRYGLIRFGSRVDLYLPKGTNPMVIVGQRTVAGETVIADFTSKEMAREGAIS